MATPDPLDLRILVLLQEDGRRTVADIAGRVALSPTAVKRRIERLEAAGVITGYSARVDYTKLGWGIAAFTELRFTGTTSPGDMDRVAAGIPEVCAVYTTAGNHDVTALIRARSVEHLRDVIHRLRVSGSIVGTRTHVILDAHVKDDWHPELDG
ncbi:Lrp/AsnC family transcriptional regulator [Baekduia soli]|uniref:Lrp/AsnC family transcriptional regulator n=1 Tax=Baekduia soli TaxID=496014 RepID=A0A5B8U9M8_9ACTN|nr:Lrp/AsnC family transcriptional regulator [Baekduia soli]QEC49770.1 Lrp/AsnC family transcriptional regulator [Baekduia soli]